MADQRYLPVIIHDKFPKLSIRHVILLQAHIRGYLVRSHMKRAREEYIELFKDLQLEDDLCVFWKSQFPCLPSFRTAKEEKMEWLGLTPIQNSDGPREITVMENNLFISKEDSKDPCDACDESLLCTISPQFPLKTPEEPIKKDDSGSLFFDDCKTSEKLLSELKSQDPIHQLQVTNDYFEKAITVKQDSESEAFFVNSDEFQQKKTELSFNEPKHCQSSENSVGVDKANFSQEINIDSKNIESINSSLSLKSFRKDDRNESLTLDSTFTDVTSVWGSVQSLSPSVDIQCESPCHETVASLQLKRQNIILELVWLKQAILSRKNYLRLKNQMDST